MTKVSFTESGNPVFRLIFSDLDGTLLDAESYGWKEARGALERCRRLAVPVILASSKTRAEMEILRAQMSLPDPFIAENGGGIFLPMDTFQEPPPGCRADGDLWKWPQGTPYEDLVGALREIRRQLGYTIRGFSEMGVEEISGLTGLATGMAMRAAMREFDEPFMIVDPVPPDANALSAAAAERGLFITEGGRFFHIHGRINKGLAMEQMVSLYSRYHGVVMSVALGDSPNDFPMLERADRPILIRSDREFSDLVHRIPGLTVTREKGPRGWNAAVLDILHTG